MSASLHSLASGLAALAVSACAAAPPPAPRFAAIQHQQHGVVGRDHPAFQKDRDECGSSVYARGIVMNGQRVTERAVADKIYMDHMIRVIARPGGGAGTGPEAGVERGAAIVTGSTKTGSTKTGSTKTGSTKTAAGEAEPDWVEAYLALDRATRDCVRARGWSEPA